LEKTHKPNVVWKPSPIPSTHTIHNPAYPSMKIMLYDKIKHGFMAYKVQPKWYNLKIYELPN
jgi:hypothetical protein